MKYKHVQMVLKHCTWVNLLSCEMTLAKDVCKPVKRMKNDIYMWDVSDSICEHLCVRAPLPVWPTPIFPSRGGAAQSSPGGRRGVCVQPPCPPSSCHITIRSCSRVANYVCVWQPHCQGGENKMAGKSKEGRVNSFLFLWVCWSWAWKGRYFYLYLCLTSLRRGK